MGSDYSFAEEEQRVELEILDYRIEQIAWSDRTWLNGTSLTVHLPSLQEQIKHLCPAIRIDYEIARPGESKRIVHVLDTVMPIAKVNGAGAAFPGFDGPAELCRDGPNNAHWQSARNHHGAISASRVVDAYRNAT